MADLSATRSVQIAAPLQRCFAIAADIDRVPEWHGAMTAVEVLDRDEAGRARLVESEIDASVAKVRMRLRFSYEEPVGVRFTRESGDLSSLDGAWRFEEGGYGMTVATYTLQIGVGRRLGMLIRTVRGPVRDKVESLLADRPVEGLRGRAEAAGADG